MFTIVIQPKDAMERPSNVGSIDTSEQAKKKKEEEEEEEEERKCS
jgi:hypothetical protein